MTIDNPFFDVAAGLRERSASHLTASEQTTLESIAQQCPLSGGWPVFKARALLYAVTGQEGNYTNACAPQQALFQAPSTNVSSSEHIRLYPNPARNEAMVQWDAPLENAGRLLLYDTYGRLLQRQPIQAGTSSYLLPLHEIEAGLYILHLSLDGEETSLKLIVNP